jgi:hypothetical protein
MADAILPYMQTNFPRVYWILAVEFAIVQAHLISLLKLEKNKWARFFIVLAGLFEVLILAPLFVKHKFYAVLMEMLVGYSAVGVICWGISILKIFRINKIMLEKQKISKDFKKELVLFAVLVAVSYWIFHLAAVLVGIAALSLYVFITRRLKQSGEATLANRIFRAAVASLVSTVVSAIVIGSILLAATPDSMLVPAIVILATLYMLALQGFTLLATGHWVGDLCRPVVHLECDLPVAQTQAVVDMQTTAAP